MVVLLRLPVSSNRCSLWNCIRIWSCVRMESEGWGGMELEILVSVPISWSKNEWGNTTSWNKSEWVGLVFRDKNRKFCSWKITFVE